MRDVSSSVLSRVEQRLRDAGCNVGSDVVLRSDRRGISMFGPDGQPVARLRNLGKNGWEVLWWSHRDKWESIGEFGGVVCDDVDEALTYVLDDQMGIFW